MGHEKTWRLLFSKRAQKDNIKIQKSPLKMTVESLLDLLEVDPYQTPPPFKFLLGALAGYYARRLNIQHRLVYSVNETSRTVYVYSMWHHYDDH